MLELSALRLVPPTALVALLLPSSSSLPVGFYDASRRQPCPRAHCNVMGHALAGFVGGINLYAEQCSQNETSTTHI
jgi:hypothetical protein